MSKISVFFVVCSVFMSACATTTITSVQKMESPVVERSYATDNYLGVKTKLAIADFTNSTPYGKRRLGEGITSILLTELSKTNRFILLEREKVDKIVDEVKLAMSGMASSSGGDFELLGADYLIMGDVTKFAVKTEGQRSLVSKTKTQTANVGADLRIVNVRTGEIVLSESGNGQAQKVIKEVMGMGGSGGYDESLEQDAFRSAVISLTEKIVSTIDRKEWMCDIVEVDGSNIYINAGRKSNLAVNTTLELYKKGDAIKDSSGRILGYKETYLGDAVVKDYLGDDASIITTSVDKGLLKMPLIAKMKK